jgi:hypothetical protein
MAQRAVEEQRAQELHEAKVITEGQKAAASTMDKVDVENSLDPLVALMAELVTRYETCSDSPPRGRAGRGRQPDRLTAPRVAVRDPDGNLIGSRVQLMQVALTGPRVAATAMRRGWADGS